MVVSSPSITLTQLKAMVDDLSGPDVSGTCTVHFNQDLAEYLGIELYREMASQPSSVCGRFFRPYAVPGAHRQRMAARHPARSHPKPGRFNTADGRRVGRH